MTNSWLRFGFSALCLFCSALSARDLKTIRASGILKVAVDGSTPGFNYFEGKKLTGLEVELAEALAKRMKLKIEWKVQPFNTLLVGLQHDRFDVIATSFAITPERSKAVDFLSPHYCSGATIFSKKGGPKTEADLTGKTVVVPVGTVYFEYLKKNKKIGSLKTLPTETAGLQDLLSGTADAWVTEKLVGLAALEKNPSIQMGESLLDQTNAMVVAKNQPDLKNVLDAELKSAMSDPSYQKLMDKYFHQDIRCRHESK